MNEETRVDGCSTSAILPNTTGAAAPVHFDQELLNYDNNPNDTRADRSRHIHQRRRVCSARSACGSVESPSGRRSPIEFTVQNLAHLAELLACHCRPSPFQHFW